MKTKWMALIGCCAGLISLANAQNNALLMEANEGRFRQSVWVK